MFKTARKTALKLALLATALSSGIAMAGMDTVTGKINGHTCAHSGITCPISNLDPHLQLEAAFVLQQNDGSYYFLSNIPVVITARHALRKATVKGNIDKKLRSIMVDQLIINGKVIWSQAMVEKARQDWEDIVGGNG